MKVVDPDKKGRDPRPITWRVAIIKITLYELVEAISEVVEVGEEKFIAEILLHLIDSGKIRISDKLYCLWGSRADSCKNGHYDCTFSQHF